MTTIYVTILIIFYTRFDTDKHCDTVNDLNRALSSSAEYKDIQTAEVRKAFRTKFVQIDHGQARPSGKREYYHFKKVD